MRNLVKIFAGFALIAMSALVFMATQNAVAAIAAVPIGAALFQQATGISIIDEQGVAMCTALVGLKRNCQTLQTGGSKRLYLVLTEDLESDVATFALAKSTGEMATGAIPLVATKKFVEIEAWYDTTKIDMAMKSGSGFEQGLEFAVMGYNKDIVKLMALLYDAPVNAIVQGNDDSLVYLGSKYIPLLFEVKGVIPAKGNTQKIVTFTAKQDGLSTPPFPLNAAVTFEVAALV